MTDEPQVSALPTALPSSPKQPIPAWIARLLLINGILILAFGVWALLASEYFLQPYKEPWFREKTIGTPLTITHLLVFQAILTTWLAIKQPGQTLGLHEKLAVSASNFFAIFALFVTAIRVQTESDLTTFHFALSGTSVTASVVAAFASVRGSRRLMAITTTGAGWLFLLAVAAQAYDPFLIDSRGLLRGPLPILLTPDLTVLTSLALILWMSRKSDGLHVLTRSTPENSPGTDTTKDLWISNLNIALNPFFQLALMIAVSFTGVLFVHGDLYEIYLVFFALTILLYGATSAYLSRVAVKLPTQSWSVSMRRSLLARVMVTLFGLLFFFSLTTTGLLVAELMPDWMHQFWGFAGVMMLFVMTLLGSLALGALAVFFTRKIYLHRAWGSRIALPAWMGMMEIVMGFTGLGWLTLLICETRNDLPTLFLFCVFLFALGGLLCCISGINNLRTRFKFDTAAFEELSRNSLTCQQCGYDLTGTVASEADHCPECGTAVPDNLRQPECGTAVPDNLRQPDTIRRARAKLGISADPVTDTITPPEPPAAPTA